TRAARGWTATSSSTETSSPAPTTPTWARSCARSSKPWRSSTSDRAGGGGAAAPSPHVRAREQEGERRADSRLRRRRLRRARRVRPRHLVGQARQRTGGDGAGELETASPGVPLRVPPRAG